MYLRWFVIKDSLQSLKTFKAAILIKCKKNNNKTSIHLHVPLKQTEKGCIHCPVNPQESFNSSIPRMK